MYNRRPLKMFFHLKMNQLTNEENYITICNIQYLINLYIKKIYIQTNAFNIYIICLI